MSGNFVMAGRHREEGSAHAAEDQVGRGRQTCAYVLAAGSVSARRHRATQGDRLGLRAA
jgi:ribosomal protein L27